MTERTRRDLALLLAAVALFTAGIARLRPPSPPDPQFLPVLADTLATLGPEPRPVGSAAHDRAEDALVAELTRLGADPVVHRSLSCGAWGRCAQVANLVGRLGPAGGHPIAVVAHYDSVGAGPGAADDGAGVAAVLAIARRYHDDPPERPVLLVLTDGEELGMLGARALVAEHALDEVAAVVNLEARGTSGPSLLFETAGPSGPAVARFADVAVRPFTSSLFDAVYQVLPNDTDLTELRSLGVPAFNLAFIGSPRTYHTPDDRDGVLSIASAAHQAAEAAALVDSLVRDPPGVDGADAVWFDVLGFGVLRFPEDWALPLAVLALGGLAFGARRTGVRSRSVAVGVGLAILGVVASAALGAGLVLALHRTTAEPWRAQAWPVQLALIGAGSAVGFGVPRLGRTEDDGVWFGGVVAATVAALAVAVALPGASFLWSVPVAVAAVLAPRPRIAAVAAAFSALVVWLPVVLMLYDALGSPLAATVSVAAAFATGGLGLVLRDGPAGRAAAAGSALLALLGALVGIAIARDPEPENVVVEYGPAGVRAFTEGGPAPVRPVEGLAPEPPVVVSTVDEDGAANLRVTSPRGAPTIGLRWDGPAAEVQVNGVDATPVRRRGRWELWINGVPPEGIDLALIPAPAALEVVDETAGLPAGMPRPTETYPFQWGDRTRAVTIH